VNQNIQRQSDERRSAVRARMLCLVDAVDPSTGDAIGFVIDLSTGGFCLLSKERFDPGAHRDVLLRMNLDGDSQEAHVAVECRWSRPALDPKYNKAGFQFQGLEEDGERLVSDALRLVLEDSANDD